jgi:hypothetical protein
MKDNSVSKIRQESESIDTTEHTTEIINFLEKLNLTNIPERKIFLEQIVSCIEPLIRKEIRNEINKYSKYYTPYWRTLVITGKHPKTISGKSRKVVDNLELGDKVVSHHTFNSINPIAKQLECFSLIDNFIIYFKNKNYLESLKEVYHHERRNSSMHEGMLTKEIESFKKIQTNFKDFIAQILLCYRASLDYGRIISAPNLKKDSKDIMKLQQIRLEKSDHLITYLDKSLKEDKDLFEQQFEILKRKFGV